MIPEPFGQYGSPTHVVAHLSDTHLLAHDARLYGRVDTDATVLGAVDRLRAVGSEIDALVITGDLTDRGEQNAYRRLRGLVQPLADELGAELFWVMGNHDARPAFRSALWDEPAPSRTPVDYVREVRGLRVIVLDTSVPGYHHGDLDDAQLQWLAGILSEPAPRGSLLALHHPPLPTPLSAMQILELERQDRLAAVVAGSDIRAILGGHLHYASTSMFEGIPVSVAAATCYTMDLGTSPGVLSGVDAGQSINLVHVYEDRVVHSVLPLAPGPVVTSFGGDFIERMSALTPEGRRDAFSRQPGAASDD
ncbi:phosphodiesterase [Rathayibacter sp. YIM 133350]|uniref:phosphodiesterase n=1 Tax=Rathayibacter sp. YIM 133350 TaxID=3131992 RepID=UPI00307E0BD8